MQNYEEIDNNDDMHTPLSSRNPSPEPPRPPKEQELECAAAKEIRMPNFMPRSTEIWFAQIESKFRLFNIRSDQHKFDYVISSVDENTAKDIYDIILDPPSADKYETVKKRVINANEDDPAEKLHRLLKGIPLGDMKPSRLLREMRLPAGNGLSHDAIEHLWLDQLPREVKVNLLGSDKDLKKKADAADRMCEASRSINAVRERTKEDMLLEEINAKVEMMCLKITQVEKDVQGRNREQAQTREKPRSRSRSRAPWRTDLVNGVCWYHEVYGDRSFKCVPGCRHAPKNE